MAIPFYHLYICQVTYHLKDLDPYPCCCAGIHTVKHIEHSDQRDRSVPGQHIKSKTTVPKASRISRTGHGGHKDSDAAVLYLPA